MRTEVGNKYDPARQEAVSVVEGEGAEDGIVLEEARAGVVDQDGEILRYVCVYTNAFFSLYCRIYIYITYICVYILHLYRRAQVVVSKAAAAPAQTPTEEQREQAATE